ncbi:MAG: hypothetical protein PHI72_06660 [Atribacterota bacterium]|jgi:hypothetical protein|nr:hypothetical protein [Atribacterota bacterium]MDD4895642.1 hypothetical protein [Atribacterota bacterium]MDD5637040.1 hypothetical protein [Atribacterota bacterium]
MRKYILHNKRLGNTFLSTYFSDISKYNRYGDIYRTGRDEKDYTDN